MKLVIDIPEKAYKRIQSLSNADYFGHDICGNSMRRIANGTPYEERPHGEWEFIGDNLFKCTHCGYVADADYLRKWKVHTYDAEFPIACLNCGADMRTQNDRSWDTSERGVSGSVKNSIAQEEGDEK